MAFRKTGIGKVGILPNFGGSTHAALYNFDVDGHSLKQEHMTFLDTQVIPILGKQGHSIVKGMTSRSGSSQHNDELSVKRAKEVVQYLNRRASSPHIFVSKGVGEDVAEAAHQIDGLEDEIYRAVSLIVSPKPITQTKVPKISKKPVPYVPKTVEWVTESISLRAKILDVFLYKKMRGHLYLTNGFCRYLAWPLSVSNLSATVGVKGKPPIWLGDMEASGAKLVYNPKIYDPAVAWDDKTIRLKMYGTTVRLTIKNALPTLPRADYQPVKREGVSISGRDLVFELKSNGGEVGIVEGIGGIEGTMSRPGTCA